MQKISQAFILAGGKGERLKPLTLETPKPLIKILGKPILQYNIELLANQGISKIILSTGYLHEKIENFFKNGEDFGVEITYSVENQPLGTGGALKNCKEKLDERFVMLNGDNIANYDFKKTNKFHEKSNAGATLQLVEVEDITGFGVAKLNKGKIIEFMEKPTKENAPSKLINAGAYIIEKWAVELIPDGFNLIEKTMFPELAKKGKLCGIKHKGYWFPTDTFERLSTAEKELKKIQNKHL
ncbi:MAG: nucleotidyltransferase family protein [Candidatus Diapherotrites archaeon]